MTASIESRGAAAAPVWASSATELVAELAAGRLSAVEVVEAHIARIEAVNPVLNAVVWKRYDAARAEAAEADRKRKAGAPLGPLHGLPITVKECLDFEGSPSTFGIVDRRDHAATGNERHLVALRRAGAILLGKTNVSQLLMFFESDNPLYGETCNPWDPDRTPGGSSGGEGAIIAAGGSPLGLGTDIGGSVRNPAAFCGIASLKPTAGRMPDLGRSSIPIGQQAIASQIGVMARKVADVALGMRVASGGDAPLEPVPALGDPAAVDVAGLRVGWFADDGVFAATPAARRAVNEAALALARRGAKVAPWQPPEPALAEALFFSILTADRFEGARRVLGKSERDPRIKLLEDSLTKPRALIQLALIATRRERARAITRQIGPFDAASYWRRVEQLIDYRERALASLGEIDVVVSPACGLPPLRHGASAEVSDMGIYTSLYNVLGWPAGVVPWTRVRAGEESDRPASKDPCYVTARETEREAAGLPIGVQVAARPWRDHVVLAALAALEQAAPAADVPETPVVDVTMRDRSQSLSR
jgi:fatty acid amide hydrolase